MHGSRKAGVGYPGTTSNGTAGAAAANAHTVSAQCYVVRIFSSGEMYVNFEGTATTGDMILSPDDHEYFAIRPGQTISVLEKDTAPDYSITEML